jgi:hypothetical protein
MSTGELRITLAPGEAYSEPLDVAIIDVVIVTEGELLQEGRKALLIEAVGSVAANVVPGLGPVVRVHLKQPEEEDTDDGGRRERGNISGQRDSAAAAGAPRPRSRRSRGG